MAKIPVILEAGRADGKLIKTNNVYDDNQEKFLSEKIKEIDYNHNDLKDEVNALTEVVNTNKSNIENKLEAEKIRATNIENNLRETINNITEINENATTANIVTIDTLPNSTASNVQQALDDLYKNIIYDVSARNGGVIFESLSVLLSSSNLSTLIPTSVRHGGMSIRFRQTSDNNYVKFFCTADEFTTDVTKWQGVDDEPTAESDNLVKSGGVYDEFRDFERKEGEKYLLLGFDYKTKGKGNQRIDNLSFKAGVTYTCTFKGSESNIDAIIYNSNDEIIHGLSLLDGVVERTNIFTPSTDISNAYFLITFASGKSWDLVIKPSVDIIQEVDAHDGTVLDANNRLLKYGLDFYVESNRYINKRINGLSFKKGVTYTCVYTNTSSDGSTAAIYDSNSKAICGISLSSSEHSRTNTFTPSTDISNAYFLCETGCDYTLSISASKDLSSELAEIRSDIADAVHEDAEKVEVNCVNLYPAKNELPSTILYNNGGNTTESGFTTSDYIPVLPNTTYSTTVDKTLRKVCFYNKFKAIPCIDFVEYVGTFTTPADTYYIRFSMTDQNVGSIVLVEGSISIPYASYNPIEGYFEDGIIKYGLTKNGEFSDNILDNSAVVLRGKFMYNDGSLLNDPNYATLNFFEVKPNTEYSCSEECGTFRKVCCFDSNTTFIQGEFFENISTFITPTNCKYVRVSVPIGVANYLMLSEGVNVKMYSPYNNAQGYLNHDGFTYLLVDEIKRMKMQEWSILRFGLFIHWGVYSAWAGKYDGLDIDGNEIHRTDGTEWMWSSFKIPKETYKAKASDFSSAGWNPDKICQLAKSVGMKYIVLTIRHHEGFSLIPTPYCEWDITSSSASTDVVMQLKNACERHGLKFGVYISALLDWNDKGGFGQQQWNNGTDPYTESEHLSFTDKQVDYCRQINDTYKPFLIWFDGGTYISQSNSVRHLFIQKQTAYFPFAITNDRGSHREGDWIEVEDGTVDNPNYTKPLERCNHIYGWGYNQKNDTPTEVMKRLVPILFDMMETMGRGFNYLLNVPPTGDGTITDNYVNWFIAASAFFRKYTFFTDAKRLFNNCQPSWGRPIYKNNSIFMFILPGGSSNVYLDSVDTGNLIGVHVYNIQKSDDQENYEVISNDRLLLKNIPTSSDDYFICVRLDFNGNVLCNDYNIVDISISPMSMVVVSRKSWPKYNTGVQYSTKLFVIGDGNSISKTRFKYAGETGNKTISLVMESSGSNNIGITILDETTNASDSATGSSVSTNLTNGHIYTMTITKSENGSGYCTISNINIS